MRRLFNWLRQRPLINWLRQRPLINWLRQRPLLNWLRQRPLLNWLRQRPLLNWLRQRPFYPLIPRRFESHYWDENHCLNFTKWWQWLGHCFFVRNRIIMKPDFSTWEQILERAKVNDKDARVIYQLIKRSNQKDLKRFYNFVVAETR